MKSVILILAGFFFSVGAQAADYFMIDGSGKSCRAMAEDPSGPDDIPAMKLVLGTLSLAWQGKTPLQLEYMRVSIHGGGLSGGYYARTFAGDDLGYSWMGRPGIVEIAPGSTVSTWSKCSIQVGGVTVLDRSVPSSGTGEILYYGTIMRNGAIEGVQITQPFSFYYDGVN